MAYREIPEEIITQVIDMTLNGRSIDEIMFETGISQNSIKRIRDRYQISSDLPQYSRADVWQWLQKNWHFKKPEKKPVKRKSNFRTPYNSGRR